MTIQIKIVSGSAKGKTFTFDRPDCFLCGRSSDAHVVLGDDPFISRHHFLIEIAPPDCRISDLNSKNGLYVNGVRYGGRKPPEPGVVQAEGGAREVFLQHGDAIMVGETEMEISMEMDARKANIHVDPLNLLQALLKEAPSVEGDMSSPRFTGYKIERELGRGGMGMVYKAVQERTGRDVAIKTMLPQMGADENHIKFFQREVDVTRQLRHPNIARLLDHGYDDGTFYFVLEYVNGMDLGRFMERTGSPPDLAEVAPIMLEMLDGLSWAHRASLKFDVTTDRKSRVSGIVHRDLKPQNVLLVKTENGWRPKIVDFGLSKSFELAGLSNMTRADQMAGTPIYWPREQITHYRYLNASSDVFSAAAIFYEWLTGRWVRHGFSAMIEQCKLQKRSPGIPDFMQIIAANPVMPIRRRNKTIPGPIARVIDKALTETEAPQDETAMRQVLETIRYKDAGEMRDALARAFKESGVTV